jgi:hypothetical protein
MPLLLKATLLIKIKLNFPASGMLRHGGSGLQRMELLDRQSLDKGHSLGDNFFCNSGWWMASKQDQQNKIVLDTIGRGWAIQ